MRGIKNDVGIHPPKPAYTVTNDKLSVERG